MLHGQLPLQTLRADIDYGLAQAFTNYGAIGVKVWLQRGENYWRRELDVRKITGPRAAQAQEREDDVVNS